MMLAPDNTNLIAPLSTWTCVKASGSNNQNKLGQATDIYERGVMTGHKPHQTVGRKAPHCPESIAKCDHD